VYPEEEYCRCWFRTNVVACCAVLGANPAAPENNMAEDTTNESKYIDGTLIMPDLLGRLRAFGRPSHAAGADWDEAVDACMSGNEWETVSLIVVLMYGLNVYSYERKQWRR